MEPSTPPPETKVNTEDFELGPLPYVEPLKLLEVEGYDGGGFGDHHGWVVVCQIYQMNFLGSILLPP